MIDPRTSDFDERLALGRRIERAIAAVLRERYAVIVVGDLPAENGHGPCVSGNGNSITLADLQIFGPVRRGWVEVKWKSEIFEYHNWNRDEHGIDRKKWDHYWQLQITTGLTVYLLIVEFETGDILMRDLHSINAFGNLRPGKFPDGKRSMNFARAALVVIGHVDWITETYRIDWDVLNTFLSQLPLFDFQETQP